MSLKVYFIPCRIERGGFTSERTFEIDVTGGGRLLGTANADYLRLSDRSALDEDTPSYGEKIDGCVACRKVKEDGQTILVEVPSSDVIHVTASELYEFA